MLNEIVEIVVIAQIITDLLHILPYPPVFVDAAGNWKSSQLDRGPLATL